MVNRAESIGMICFSQTSLEGMKWFLSVFIVNNGKGIYICIFIIVLKAHEYKYINRTVMSCDPVTLKSQCLEEIWIIVIEWDWKCRIAILV